MTTPPHLAALAPQDAAQVSGPAAVDTAALAPQTAATPPHPAAPATTTRYKLLNPGAWAALGKTIPVATVAVLAPFSAWGSLTTTWAHVIWLIGGRDHGTSGGHILAGTVGLAAIGAAWAIDPGSAEPGTKHRLRTTALHYLSRVLRWAATCGSLLYIPVALGVIHLTTGAH